MTKITVFLLLVVVALIAGRLLKKAPETTLSAAIISQAYIVDVRQPEEFAAGHFAGAVNIPLGDIQGHVATLKEQTKPIIVYCRSGNRSGQVKALLAKHGVSVFNGINQKTLETAK